ncbi:MAG: hypothetical protein KatS3mg105_0308 [Gemmatales bacterium]|nr:MAG: hypothetical protein KatS3mg105_0308 [Gemmatales bacterium]
MRLVWRGRTPPARFWSFTIRRNCARLEQIRQEFVGNVSHELKTPLSVIKASVETLLDGAADDANYRDSFLKRIEEQADRLHALILDLLSLNRIESGTEVFDFQPVPLATVVLSAVDRQRGRAEAKKQNLLVMVPDGRGGFQPFRDATAMPDLFAWADVDAVSQILDNLIDNALKYTPEKGTITVRWFASGGNACLQVEDTGIGIPQADLPRIFERFYRVDKARSRELGGTGLGLAIVKHLTQAMRGSVQVRSEIGAGTTFTVSLPLASSSEFFALPSSKLHR